jgi:hypothetical protein
LWFFFPFKLTSRFCFAGDRKKKGGSSLTRSAISQASSTTAEPGSVEPNAKRRPRTVFTLSYAYKQLSATALQETCLAIASNETTDLTTVEPALAPIQSLFGSLCDVRTTLSKEGFLGFLPVPSFFFLFFFELTTEYYEAEALVGSWPQAAVHVHSLAGHLPAALVAAISSRTLTEGMVALSAGAGQTVWRATAQAYAEQQLQASDFTGAAEYFTACHRIPDAVQAYLSANLYPLANIMHFVGMQLNCNCREAVALVRSQLGDDDPLISAVFEQWASHAESLGHFEIAANWCVPFTLPSGFGCLLFGRPVFCFWVTWSEHVLCCKGVVPRGL